MTTIIDLPTLRARPDLVAELRAHPGQHVERRSVPLSEVRAKTNDDGTYTFGGLAAVFEDLSLNLGGFREQIKRGAFRKVLASKPDVRAMFNHDPSLLLARTVNDTLRLSETTAGLDYEGDAAPTSVAADLKIWLDRRDITQSSFGFRIAPGGDTWDEDPETGALIRTIIEIGELFDVSPVTDPAYPQTTVGLRAQAPSEVDESQHDARGKAPQPGVEGDSSHEATDDGTDAAQGDPWRAAARRRRLRMVELQLG